MEHWVENRRSPIDRNPYTVSPTIKVNHDNWGLGDYDLEIQQAKNIALHNKPLTLQLSTKKRLLHTVTW